MNILRILADSGPTNPPREILALDPMEFLGLPEKRLHRCLEVLAKEISNRLKPGEKLAWRWETWGAPNKGAEPLDVFCKSILSVLLDKNIEW